MNLPSLALPRSKFFQSRLGILVLALVAVLLGGGVFFALRPIAPPTLPTAATSPAAQAPVRAVPVRPAPLAPKVVEVAPDTYGPFTPGMTWHSSNPAATAAAAAAAAAPAPVGSAAATAAGAAPGAAAPAGAVPATGAASAGAVALPGPAVPAVPGAPAVAGAVETPKSLAASVLFQREQYTYTGDGRRDPFQSLLDGKFQGSGDGALIDVGDIHLVGIMWGAADKFALVEDSRGRGFVLRVGDPVVNGYISGISKTELSIIQNAFGESQSMSIKLQPKEGDQNATRN
jgi:hypothetical protein